MLFSPYSVSGLMFLPFHFFFSFLWQDFETPKEHYIWEISAFSRLALCSCTAISNMGDDLLWNMSGSLVGTVNRDVYLQLVDTFGPFRDLHICFHVMYCKLSYCWCPDILRSGGCQNWFWVCKVSIWTSFAWYLLLRWGNCWHFYLYDAMSIIWVQQNCVHSFIYYIKEATRPTVYLSEAITKFGDFVCCAGSLFTSTDSSRWKWWGFNKFS